MMILDMERMKVITLTVHEKVIRLFGGRAGVRDEGLLESALMRPQNLQAYGGQVTPFRLAASLAYGLAKNHSFLDGNKRVSLVMCEWMLSRDGYTLSASKEEKYTTFMQLADGTMSEEEFSRWVSKKSKKITISNIIRNNSPVLRELGK